eukprot:295604-Rhodomonas_salina.2
MSYPAHKPRWASLARVGVGIDDILAQQARRTVLRIMRILAAASSIQGVDQLIAWVARQQAPRGVVLLDPISKHWTIPRAGVSPDPPAPQRTVIDSPDAFPMQKGSTVESSRRGSARKAQVRVGQMAPIGQFMHTGLSPSGVASGHSGSCVTNRDTGYIGRIRWRPAVQPVSEQAVPRTLAAWVRRSSNIDEVREWEWGEGVRGRGVRYR